MIPLNINVGLLGHVDSGKTSLAKALSSTVSTACFDKSPQSQERGITIDLGFSSFCIDLPEKFSQNCSYQKLQFTLVDCPGHASLIKTVIGGVQIIDVIILVVDVTKGIQTQTAECIVVGEIIKKPLVLVLNKIDLIEESKREVVIEKVKRKLVNTIKKTKLNCVSVVAISANPGGSPIGLDGLVSGLIEASPLPERNSDKPTIFCVDHCFSIKGKGTILTGTVLQGSIKINDELEIPSIGVKRKVKSMQMFHQDVEKGLHGDRLGVCMTQFDPKLLERGLVCSPGTISTVHAVILSLQPVQYYKANIDTVTKYHVTLGYQTVLAKLVPFNTSPANSVFSLEQQYEVQKNISTNDIEKTTMFALVELESPVPVWEGSLVIGSRLDHDIHTALCRVAFSGQILHVYKSKNYRIEELPKLKLFQYKEKTGLVNRVVNENEIIIHSLFKKETNIDPFINFTVTLSTGEQGSIHSSFGKTGKIKVHVPSGLSPDTIARASLKKKTPVDEIEVVLKFKKFMFGSKEIISV